jgi:hypothetical protein
MLLSSLPKGKLIISVRLIDTKEYNVTIEFAVGTHRPAGVAENNKDSKLF